MGVLGGWDHSTAASFLIMLGVGSWRSLGEGLMVWRSGWDAGSGDRPRVISLSLKFRISEMGML